LDVRLGTSRNLRVTREAADICDLVKAFIGRRYDVVVSYNTFSVLYMYTKLFWDTVQENEKNDAQDAQVDLQMDAAAFHILSALRKRNIGLESFLQWRTILTDVRSELSESLDRLCAVLEDAAEELSACIQIPTMQSEFQTVENTRMLRDAEEFSVIFSAAELPLRMLDVLHRQLSGIDAQQKLDSYAMAEEQEAIAWKLKRKEQRDMARSRAYVQRRVQETGKELHTSAASAYMTSVTESAVLKKRPPSAPLTRTEPAVSPYDEEHSETVEVLSAPVALLPLPERSGQQDKWMDELQGAKVQWEKGIMLPGPWVGWTAKFLARWINQPAGIEACAEWMVEVAVTAEMVMALRDKGCLALLETCVRLNPSRALHRMAAVRHLRSLTGQAGSVQQKLQDEMEVIRDAHQKEDEGSMLVHRRAEHERLMAKLQERKAEIEQRLIRGVEYKHGRWVQVDKKEEQALLQSPFLSSPAAASLGPVTLPLSQEECSFEVREQEPEPNCEDHLLTMQGHRDMGQDSLIHSPSGSPDEVSGTMNLVPSTTTTTTTTTAKLVHDMQVAAALQAEEEEQEAERLKLLEIEKMRAARQRVLQGKGICFPEFPSVHSPYPQEQDMPDSNRTMLEHREVSEEDAGDAKDANEDAKERDDQAVGQIEEEEGETSLWTRVELLEVSPHNVQPLATSTPSPHRKDTPPMEAPAAALPLSPGNIAPSPPGPVRPRVMGLSPPALRALAPNNPSPSGSSQPLNPSSPTKEPESLTTDTSLTAAASTADDLYAEWMSEWKRLRGGGGALQGSSSTTLTSRDIDRERDRDRDHEMPQSPTRSEDDRASSYLSSRAESMSSTLHLSALESGGSVSVRLKVSLEGDRRMLEVAPTILLEELLEMLQSEYGEGPFSLFYRDEDDETVTVATQRNLSVSLRQAAQLPGGGPPLKLFLKRTPRAAASPLSTASASVLPPRSPMTPPRSSKTPSKVSSTTSSSSSKQPLTVSTTHSSTPPPALLSPSSQSQELAAAAAALSSPSWQAPETPPSEALLGRYALRKPLDWIGGNAHEGLDYTTHRRVSIIVMPKRDEGQRCAATWRHLQSEFVLPLIDQGFDARRNAFILVAEAPDASLTEIVLSRSKLPIYEVRYIAHSIGKCLDYLHSRGIAHNALTPQSVVRIGGRWVLTTLLYARPFGSKALPATLPGLQEEKYGRYTPAEYKTIRTTKTMLQGQSSQSQSLSLSATNEGDGTLGSSVGTVDAFAFGCLLFHLVYRRPCFPVIGTVLDPSAYQSPFRDVPANKGDDQARHLLEKILCSDPAKRPPLTTIMKHAFFTGGMDTVQMKETLVELRKAVSSGLINPYDSASA
jgi:serine/threonine protein kinase